ncbi:MAG TPA: hypothetical protein VIJ82_32660, partial [Streptosporangiaceae bacterium]
WVAGEPPVQAGAEGLRGTPGPLETKSATRNVPPGVSPDQFCSVIYFRDAAGARWTLTPDGQIEASRLSWRPGFR